MEPATEFPAHRVLTQLGEGAHSRVFLGKSLVDNSARALKLFDLDPRATHRFNAELHTLSQVTHPHIVTLLEFGYTLDGLNNYLGLEYLDGKDFISGSKDVSQDEFITLIVQVLSALELLHRRGFCHGDLTPHHLIVSAANCASQPVPNVKLIDFGASQWSGTQSIDFT